MLALEIIPYFSASKVASSRQRHCFVETYSSTCQSQQSWHLAVTSAFPDAITKFDAYGLALFRSHNLSIPNNP
jgi:hypothetical protein